MRSDIRFLSSRGPDEIGKTMPHDTHLLVANTRKTLFGALVSLPPVGTATGNKSTDGGVRLKTLYNKLFCVRFEGVENNGGKSSTTIVEEEEAAKEAEKEEEAEEEEEEEEEDQARHVNRSFLSLTNGKGGGED
jgi:hypothetical protein